MSYIEPRYQKQGQAAEEAFASWLNASALPYIYVEQSPVTVPEKLRGLIKRPDYLIGIPSVGNISCDVKCKSAYDDALIFDEYEFLNLANFERFFMSSVWLACYQPDDLTHCYLFQNDWLLREKTTRIKGKRCVVWPLSDALSVDTSAVTFCDALMQAVDLS